MQWSLLAATEEPFQHQAPPSCPSWCSAVVHSAAPSFFPALLTHTRSFRIPSPGPPSNQAFLFKGDPSHQAFLSNPFRDRFHPPAPHLPVVYDRVNLRGRRGVASHDPARSGAATATFGPAGGEFERWSDARERIFAAFDAARAPSERIRMELEGREVLRNVMNAPATRVRASKALPATPGSPMDVDARTPRRTTRKMRHAEAENYAFESPLGSPPPMYEASGKKGSREAMLEAENARLARCAAEFEATLKRMRETESRSHVEARRQLTDLEAKNRRLTEEHELLLQNFQQLTDKYHAYKERFQQARESDQAWQTHLKQVNAQCDKEVADIRKEKEEAVKKMQEANLRLDELKKSEAEATKRAEGAERTAQLATTRADENERLLKDAEARCDAAVSSVGELKKELETQKESFNRSEKALKESKQTAKTMQKALDEYKRENSRSHTALQEALRRIDALERDNAQLADMCSSAVAQLERMQLSPEYSE